MTRETKLGLVVAGSFLALVGGVVSMKYAGKTAPGAAPQQELPASGTQAGTLPTPEGSQPAPHEIQQVSSIEPKSLPVELSTHNQADDILHSNDNPPHFVTAPPALDEPPSDAGVKVESVPDILSPEVKPVLPPTARKEEPKQPKLTLVLPSKNSTPNDAKVEPKGGNVIPVPPLVVSGPPDYPALTPVDPKIVIEKKPMNGEVDIPLISPDDPKSVIEKKPMNGEVDVPLILPDDPKVIIGKKPVNEVKDADIPLIPLEAPKPVNEKKPTIAKNIESPIVTSDEPTKVPARVEPKLNAVDSNPPPPLDTIVAPAVTEFKSTKSDRGARP